MRILIAAATEKELGLLRKELDFVHKIDDNLYNYKLGKHIVDMLITGIGGVFTTYSLTKVLTLFNYDLAFNVGIAGSFDHFLEIGNVVNVVEDRFGDLGVEDKDQFYTLCEKELLGENEFPFKNCAIFNNTPFTFDNIEQLVAVKGITVNTVHGNQQSIDRILSKFKPEVETMEGAAFFYVCKKENIPFYQIRAISNYVEIRNVENWNISLALQNQRDVMVKIFEEIKSI